MDCERGAELRERRRTAAGSGPRAVGSRSWQEEPAGEVGPRLHLSGGTSNQHPPQYTHARAFARVHEFDEHDSEHHAWQVAISMWAAVVRCSRPPGRACETPGLEASGGGENGFAEALLAA